MQVHFNIYVKVCHLSTCMSENRTPTYRYSNCNVQFNIYVKVCHLSNCMSENHTPTYSNCDATRVLSV